MLQNVFGSGGRSHVEKQIGSLRCDLTTGKTKMVIPGSGNMNTVFDNDGVHIEFQTG